MIRNLLLFIVLVSTSTVGNQLAAREHGKLAEINEFRTQHGLEALPEELSRDKALQETADDISGAKLVDLWKFWDKGDTPGTPNLKSEPVAKSKLTFERVKGLVPPNRVYSALQTEFLKMSKEVSGSSQSFEGLPRPKSGEVVKPGEAYIGAKLLAKILTQQGYMKDAAVGRQEMVPALVDGVKAFQQEQGLVVDGVIGPNTLEALNQSPQEKLQTLKLNMNRARLLPNDMGERYLLANLPGGMVHGFEGGAERPAISMRIVYGADADDRKTVVFRDQLEHVVFRPFWRIPSSIAADEIVPKALENLGYLAEKKYQIVAEYDGEPMRVTRENLDAVKTGELKMRQEPGGSNSLGLVKFLFPNDHAIYFHDTPADELFEKSKRAFSHGCVRLEKPRDMALWVLGAQGWDRKRVNFAIETGEANQWVNIEKSIPVYITYFTAFPDPETATIRYYSDVYNRDVADSNSQK